MPTPRKNPAKGSQRGKAKKPGNRRNLNQTAKRKRKTKATVKSLAEQGCTAEDIILELGLNLDSDEAQKKFDGTVRRGHAKHRNVILENLNKQAQMGTTTATKALAGAYVSRFQGMEDDLDEAGLVQRVEAEIDKALVERKAAAQVDHPIKTTKKATPKKRARKKTKKKARR